MYEAIYWYKFKFRFGSFGIITLESSDILEKADQIVPIKKISSIISGSFIKVDNTIVYFYNFKNIGVLNMETLIVE